MADIVERLRDEEGQTSLWELCIEAADEIEQLQADKAAISDTASGYLHEIERLRGDNRLLKEEYLEKEARVAELELLVKTMIEAANAEANTKKEPGHG